MAAAAPALAGIEMDEYEYLETLANSSRFEFTNGVVTAKRGPCMTQKKHVSVATEFMIALALFARQTGGYAGQTPTTNLSNAESRLYRLPDLAYWGPDRRVGASIFEPPTAAVEIVSPDQSVAMLREKCRFYRAHRVDVCWLVDPERRWVEVWDATREGVRVADDAALESTAMPGFHLPVASLWAAIDAAPE